MAKLSIRAALMAGAAVAGLGTGAAQAQEEKLTIWTIAYTSDAQVQALMNAATGFEETHPGVDVEIVQRGIDEHKTALRVAAGASTGPDIYMSWAGLGLGGEYVAAGLSADISKYYEQYGWADRLSAPSLAFASQFGEGMHGIPFRFSGEAIYYNKTLFEEAGIESEPQTYDELVAAAQKLADAGIPAFTFGGTVNWHLMRLMDNLLETECGAETHDALMAMELNWAETACATDAFSEMQMWAQNYILSPFMGIDQAQSFNLYVAGRAAMMLEGDWLVNQLNEVTDIADYDVFPFPTGTDRLYGFAEYFYISTKTDDPDLAAEFFDFFTSDDYQEQVKGTFGAISVNMNVDLDADALPIEQQWYDIFANAKGTFVNGDQAFPLDVTTEYFRVINDVASGNMEPSEAAGEMQTFINNRG
ncbi:ABC transporter substrate-binding protein [Martelella mangrovi]|uniref:Raffinose/stachyose/melibiose transport system substrate-binding protein n=1 Tax=Martelella mangrovi TaxID=1397477 RepID=A0ABV2I775_9HYPH